MLGSSMWTWQENLCELSWDQSRKRNARSALGIGKRLSKVFSSFMYINLSALAIQKLHMFERESNRVTVVGSLWYTQQTASLWACTTQMRREKRISRENDNGWLRISVSHPCQECGGHANLLLAWNMKIPCKNLHFARQVQKHATSRKRADPESHGVYRWCTVCFPSKLVREFKGYFCR